MCHYCKFPASKCQPLQVTEPHCSKTGCSTTPHNRTESIDPNRRPYTTERLLFTQNTGCQTAVPIRRSVHSSLKVTKDNPNVVQSTMNCYQLDRDTHSTFQLVFQVRIPSPCQYTDSRHKFAMRRRHSPNCDEMITADEHNALNTIKYTDSLVPFYRSTLSVRSIPSLPH